MRGVRELMRIEHKIRLAKRLTVLKNHMNANKQSICCVVKREGETQAHLKQHACLHV